MRNVNVNLNESQTLWEQIVADFQLACVLRREGRGQEAAEIIDQRLPRVIARWSQADGRSGAEKQAALKAMFAEEQSRDESADQVPQILAAKLAATLLPALRQHVAQELREGIAQEFRAWQNNLLLSRRPPENAGLRRVRFDDIPGVIDALLAEQKSDWTPQRAAAY